MSLAHSDEVEARHQEVGHIGGTWQDLGRAAGSVTIGVKRIRVDPDSWSTPAHVEGAEEEIFYVLGGSGLSWQDGTVYEVAAGDCLVHLAGAEAHTLRAGEGGLDVLAFGTRVAVEVGYLPRAGVGWLSPTWAEVGQGPTPWQREAAAGEPEVGESAPRPGRIVNVADVEPDTQGHGRFQGAWRNLGRAAGSERTGMKHVELPPDALSCPQHCHSAEEEIFVVLDGEGVLWLGDDETPVRAGHVVARPAGTGVAHAFRGGAGGLTYLAYGTREPNDIAYYPRSNKVLFSGVDLIARVEPLDYWDGEA